MQVADLDERQRFDQDQNNVSQAQNYTSQSRGNVGQVQSNTSQSQNYTNQTQSNTGQSQNYTNQTRSNTGQSQDNTSQAQSYTSQSQGNTSQEQLYASLEQSNVRQFSNDGYNGTEGFQEETAAEIAPPLSSYRQGTNTGEQGRAKEGSTGMGLAALALSILSLFVFPVLFGITGIVLGFIARGRGSRTGTWAITIGAISLLLGIFVFLISLRGKRSAEGNLCITLTSDNCVSLLFPEK
jgi:cobalamin biosynthesis Mg chelatase CobN